MESDAGIGGFLDPLEVVDRTDMAYEERLAILQEWRARLANEGAAEASVRAVDGAIQALEMGARLQGDRSDEVPEDYDGRRAR